MRVAEEPVCIYLFGQNPVFTFFYEISCSCRTASAGPRLKCAGCCSRRCLPDCVFLSASCSEIIIPFVFLELISAEYQSPLLNSNQLICFYTVNISTLDINAGNLLSWKNIARWRIVVFEILRKSFYVAASILPSRVYEVRTSFCLVSEIYGSIGKVSVYSVSTTSLT